jgi:hypothetical protein
MKQSGSRSLKSFIRIFAGTALLLGAQEFTMLAEAVEPGSTSRPMPTTAPEDEPWLGKAVIAFQQRKRVAKGGYVDLALNPRPMIMRVVTNCRALVANQEDCDSMPIFAPGDDIWAAAQHDRDAIAAGQPPSLNYRSEADHKKNGILRDWYAGFGNTNGSNPCQNYDGAILHCDEYPFFSTAQAGLGASLRVINKTDNIKEGARLESFYNTCGLKEPAAETGQTKKFLVIPIQGPVRGLGFNSAAWCASEKKAA